jgi:hypothetical protein
MTLITFQFRIGFTNFEVRSHFCQLWDSFMAKVTANYTALRCQEVEGLGGNDGPTPMRKHF